MTPGWLLGDVGMVAPPEVLFKVAAEAFGVEVADIMGTSCRQPISTYRQITMAAFREVGKFSYPVLGDLFSRHHTTVIHACERIGRTHRGARDRLVDAMRTAGANVEGEA